MGTAAATARSFGAAAAPPLADPADEGLGDLRFRALLGAEAWADLPPPIRRRFSKRLAGGATAVYVGEVVDVRTIWAGRLLAQAARPIAEALPLVWTAGTPSVVTVTEDVVTGGQIWTRLYAGRRGFPQVIHSSKRFAGPTGLEEHVGCGVGMTLRVAVEHGALVFRSERYFVCAGRRRLTLPRWAEPGRLAVTHQELGQGRFAFVLELEHPLAGWLLRQHAVFREERP